MTRPAHPFLKWPGGKRWLFSGSPFLVPNYTGTYIEPFLGGGAVFFRLQPNSALLSDTNERLIELYMVIRDQFDELSVRLKEHSVRHCRDYYYELRAKEFVDPSDRAAQFLYLNRTCWNGLYRVNKQGKFNVPIGTKNTVIFPTDDFLGWSTSLKRASLTVEDFEPIIDSAHPEDFLFVDPPYAVKKDLSGFLKYNNKTFGWEDQLRLREALSRAHARGVQFAMTNAYHQSILDLYKDFENKEKLQRYSVIAGNPKGRFRSNELLITNYQFALSNRQNVLTWRKHSSNPNVRSAFAANPP